LKINLKTCLVPWTNQPYFTPTFANSLVWNVKPKAVQVLMTQTQPNITNLTFHDLVMGRRKICSFIICTFHTLISCIENIFDTWIYWKMWNLCEIHSFIGSYFIQQYVYSCMKCVFNAWYLFVKYTNLWMDEFCMIFIINSLHDVKFEMNTLLVKLT